MEVVECSLTYWILIINQSRLQQSAFTKKLKFQKSIVNLENSDSTCLLMFGFDDFLREKRIFSPFRQPVVIYYFVTNLVVTVAGCVWKLWRYLFELLWTKPRSLSHLPDLTQSACLKMTNCRIRMIIYGLWYVLFRHGGHPWWYFNDKYWHSSCT